MRIVYLHQYFVTPAMPGGVRSYEMARRLVAAGHEVHLVTSDRENARGAPLWRESCEAGIHVHWTPVAYENSMGYPRRMLAFALFAWRAANKAAALEGDVIFATSTPLTIALPAVFAARRSGVPMVFEVRDLWPAVPIALGVLKHPIARWLANRLERFAYRNATRIVALAPGMKNDIVDKGVVPEYVTVIPNGCDPDGFSHAEAGNEIRRRHAWLATRPMLLYAGSFGRINGTDYLVRLAAAIRQIDPEIRVVGVGGGGELERTRQMARDMGVLDVNLFLLGRVPSREALVWNNAADMTIALIDGPEILTRDAVQNKFFDSLAAGKPVASNFSGFQSKIAVEAEAGLIVSRDDVPSAAQDIVSALRNESWMRRAGAAARSLAEVRFNLDLLAVDLERVLTDAMADGAVRGMRKRRGKRQPPASDSPAA